MADNKELATALKMAKTKDMYFAIVANGTDGKLLVDKKKISAKESAEAKKECGGGTVYKGRVKGEEGGLVFEMAKEAPGALTALTKKIIKKEAGLTLEVGYRVAKDLEEEITENEGTESGVPEPPPLPKAPVPETPVPPPPNEAATRFANRLKALGPVLEKLTTANKAAANQAKTAIGEGNQAYLAKQYDEANKALDRAEQLIKYALSSVSPGGSPPPPPPPPPSGDSSGPNVNELAKRVLNRILALDPVLKKIEGLDNDPANKARQAVSEARQLAGKKDFGAANDKLDIAEGLIKEAIKLGAVPPPPPPPGSQTSVPPPPPPGSQTSVPPPQTFH